MKKDSRILIVGHKDLIKEALMKRLQEDGFKSFFAMPEIETGSQICGSTRLLFEKKMPEYIFLLGASSGGIMANASRPADLIYDNLKIQNSVIHSAWKSKVKKLIFVASSCVYPKKCRQPMKEEYLLSGSLEPTSEAFSIAKIAGIKMCQSYNKQYGTNFISVIPATPYGRYDDFDPRNSHVIPALICKFHQAKIKDDSTVSIWGTGRPIREFIHADDLADALIFLMRDRKSPELINVGTGDEISIGDLARSIKEIVGFKGRLKFDTSKPGGASRKSLDTRRLKVLGWKAGVSLKDGLEDTYAWYIQNEK